MPASEPNVNRRQLFICLLAELCAQVACTDSVELVETVAGPVPVSELGVTLIHEHVVADLRVPGDREEGDYDSEEAERVTLPHIQALRNKGCRTLVDPTPIGMGRDPALLKRLSNVSGLKVVCATGFFGAADYQYLPDFARQASAEEIAARYVQEATEGIGLTGIRPGVIKTGVNPSETLGELDRKLVRAAALAHQSTGLTILSHTGPAGPAFEQLQMLDSFGVQPSCFVWVHADNEKDHRLHIRAARMGAWVEFDSLNRSDFFDWHLTCLSKMAEAGTLGRALISQDAGHYHPGTPGGGAYKPYTVLFDQFVPRLRDLGFQQSEIDQLLIENPRKALAGC